MQHSSEPSEPASEYKGVVLLAEMRRRIEELEQENTDLRDDQEAAERVRAMPHLARASCGGRSGEMMDLLRVDFRSA